MPNSQRFAADSALTDHEKTTWLDGSNFKALRVSVLFVRKMSL